MTVQVPLISVPTHRGGSTSSPDILTVSRISESFRLSFALSLRIRSIPCPARPIPTVFRCDCRVRLQDGLAGFEFVDFVPGEAEFEEHGLGVFAVLEGAGRLAGLLVELHGCGRQREGVAVAMSISAR